MEDLLDFYSASHRYNPNLRRPRRSAELATGATPNLGWKTLAFYRANHRYNPNLGTEDCGFLQVSKAN